MEISKKQTGKIQYKVVHKIQKRFRDMCLCDHVFTCIFKVNQHKWTQKISLLNDSHILFHVGHGKVKFVSFLSDKMFQGQ